MDLDQHVEQEAGERAAEDAVVFASLLVLHFGAVAVFSSLSGTRARIHTWEGCMIKVKNKHGSTFYEINETG